MHLNLKENIIFDGRSRINDTGGAVGNACRIRQSTPWTVAKTLRAELFSDGSESARGAKHFGKVLGGD